MPLFPPIEPYVNGALETPDGHNVYWESCGNPNGEPALFLHGGPGSGASANARRFFDPLRFRAVLFDQRGCGRSRPLADADDADLGTNTTAHLVADIEALRLMLGIERWTILGVSWGTTLALAYARAHPERVRAMVLALVTTTSRREVDWITKGVGRFFPAQWRRFADAVPHMLRDMPIVDAYATMLFDPDDAVRQHAASEWCEWEVAHVSLGPGAVRDPRFDNAAFRLRFARLVTHYWRHAAFLEDERLVSDTSRLNGIPGRMLHGRFDVSGPIDTAWQIAQRWRTSELRVIDIGHGDGEVFPAAVIAALEGL